MLDRNDIVTFKSNNYEIPSLNFYSPLHRRNTLSRTLLSMAWNRFRSSYSRSPYRRSYSSFRGGRARWGAGKKTAWYNRNNKAAYSMAGGQNVQITTVETFDLTVAIGQSNVYSQIPIDTSLTTSVMHQNMSNVYDQFRIRKITMKFQPTGTPGGNDANKLYSTFYTAMDRNGFADGVTLDMIRTYQSYKQTVYAAVASNKAPVHYVSWTNNTLFEKSRYFNTKLTPTTETVLAGVSLPANVAGAAATFSFTVTIQYDLTYRGLRADTSAIAAGISPPE